MLKPFKPQTAAQPIRKASPFSRIRDAQVPSYKSPFFTAREVVNVRGEVVKVDGHYTIQILRCKYVSGLKGEYFIVEGKVLESDVETLQAGSTASWRQSLTGQYPNVAMGNILQFCLAALQIQIEDKVEAGVATQALCARWQELTGSSAEPEEILEVICSKQNPLRGFCVELTCSHKVTKAGKDFTVHSWAISRVTPPDLGDDEQAEYEVDAAQ